MRKVALVLLATGAAALELPSCNDDTDAHCVGEGADLSSEGINKCLEMLGDGRSARCTKYLELMSACAADMNSGGACESAAYDGEAVPCLIQRVAPEKLSVECQAVLPRETLKGLAKYWKDGKRQLNIDEISDLNIDDKDTYTRWMKRKKGKKTEKDRERDYAVKVAKKERTISLITAAVVLALKETGSPTIGMATEQVQKEAKKAVDEDMTGTLKPFSKGEIAGIAKAALKQVKDEL